MTIGILLVEDHYLARLGVTTLIDQASGMEVVARAETGWQAVAAFAQRRPDLVLMDLRLPEMDGVEATAQICRNDPGARVLILSHYDNEQDVFRALDAGALGYLNKDVDGNTLIASIRTVAAGQRCLPRALAESWAKTKDEPQMTRREMQVLEEIFRGRSNEQIGETMGITEGTVRIHVSNIFYKLHVKRRTEAVAMALKKGLIRPP